MLIGDKGRYRVLSVRSNPFTLSNRKIHIIDNRY